jgi:dephospho-CoA kinase
MVYCVGLTGTVASGKSTAAKIFANLDIEVICSDTLAKQLTVANQPAFQAIMQHFGEELRMPNGELNRRLLRDIIFKTESERLWLENLLHPLIRKAIIEHIQQVQSPYCIIEIPLLYKRSDFPFLHAILAISIPDSVTISRVMKRDHCSKAEAEAILTLQKHKIDNETIVDDIIVNTGSLAKLEATVIELHNHYLWKSKQL